MFADLIIVPEAQQDVDEAYWWYEDCRSGLGEEFLGCVDACIQTICRMSDLYPVIHEQYRRALVRRFPFSVFYENSALKVTVDSIFTLVHGKWLSRFFNKKL